MVVSGIKPKANVGYDVTYSGTVTAAMESIIWGVPAIAISLDSKENHLGDIDYDPAAGIARKLVERINSNRIPAGIFVNLNIPNLAEDDIQGFQITRQGMRVYRDRLDQLTDPRGRPYFWIAGDLPTGIPENGTDFEALEKGQVSITPLHLDLTAYPAMHILNTWSWKSIEVNEPAYFS